MSSAEARAHRIVYFNNIVGNAIYFKQTVLFDGKKLIRFSKIFNILISSLPLQKQFSSQHFLNLFCYENRKVLSDAGVTWSQLKLGVPQKYGKLLCKFAIKVTWFNISIARRSDWMTAISNTVSYFNIVSNQNIYARVYKSSYEG